MKGLFRFRIFAIVAAVFAVAVSSQHALATTSPAACTMSGATGAGTPSYTVNVGAPVSGGGDSSSEINSAISTASAAGGGNVVLQAGTYYISNPITVKAGVNLTGASEATTVIQATTSLGSGSVVQTSTNSNITIQNMTLNQDGSNQTTRSLSNYLLDLGGGTNYIVENVATRNPSTYSMGIHYGTSVFCVFNNNVQDTNMSGNFANLDGIHVTHASYGDIVNNFVDQMAGGSTGGDDGIAIQVESCGTGCNDNGDSSNINVTGNIVRGGATAGDFDFAISGGYVISNVTVAGNEFWGGPDGLRDANFGGGGTLSNVTLTDNFSHNNAATPQQGGLPQRGYTLPYNSGITQSNIVVDGWYWCSDAGGAPVPSSGTSNGVTASGVVQYTTCADAPSTTTAPPAYPPGSGSAPAAPTNLAASTVSSSQINLTWTGSSGATSYNVYQSTTSGFTPGSGNEIASGVATTTYSNTGLTASTTYYYVVEAVNGYGTSGPSNQASAETSGASSNCHSGTWCLKGTLPATANYTNVSEVESSAGSSTYVASVWIKGSGSVQLYIDAGNWGANLVSVECTATSSWTQCTTAPFSTGSNTQLTYILQDSYSGAGTVYLDDTFLGVSAGTNILVNPGFESGNNYWANSSGATWAIGQY
jgi:hypothetical protein